MLKIDAWIWIHAEAQEFRHCLTIPREKDLPHELDQPWKLITIIYQVTEGHGSDIDLLADDIVDTGL